MGRQFFVSGFKREDRWVTDELELRAKNTDRHPGAEDLVTENRPIIDPRTGEVAVNPVTGRKRYRPVKRDSALGFDSTEVHYAGDRIVTVAEEVEIQGGKPTGRILHHFMRYGDDGRSLGEHVQPWEKTAEGRFQQAGKAKRKYYT